MKCPECGSRASMVHRDEMGFVFTPKGPKCFEYYWRCRGCGAYTPADQRTKKPWGLMAGPELRKKRQQIHRWEDKLVGSGLYTWESFRWLIGGIVGESNPQRVHVRMMTMGQCNAVLELLEQVGRNNERVRGLLAV